MTALGVVAALAMSALFAYLGIRWLRNPSELEKIRPVSVSESYAEFFVTFAPFAFLASSVILLVYTLFAAT